VSIFVPTPSIEALRTIVSDRLKGVGMSFEMSRLFASLSNRWLR
jgi:hypothetical protein